MPHVSRTAQRSYARDLRAVGEQVIVLIDPTDSNNSTDTPLDPTLSNEAINIAGATRVILYAKVAWQKQSEDKFEEAGKAVFSKATVSTTSQTSIYLQQCFAVILANGAVMRKESGNLSETRAIYTITVSGYVGIDQTQ